MKAVVVKFDYQSLAFERLLGVFIESWRHNTKIRLEVERIDPPEIRERNEDFYFNHKKLGKWIDLVNQDTILIDADMLCLNDITDGFDTVQHIGITERPGTYPINGGVVFVKNTRKAKAFMREWYSVDAQMLKDEKFHLKWKDTKRNGTIAGGMNQASMRYLLENGWDSMVRRLPCSTYNLCDGQWDAWRQARMIHIKGMLRNKILGKPVPAPYNGYKHYDEIRKVWRGYEKLAIEREKRTSENKNDLIQ